jgi:hypothetical protein
LDDSLEAGWQLQLELKARGGTCFLEPAACVELTSPSSVSRFIARFFVLGRRVAAQRRRHWSTLRRMAYAAGAPLVPFVRLARLLADAIRRKPAHVEWPLLPLVVIGLVASAAGESVGYLSGEGSRSRFER